MPELPEVTTMVEELKRKVLKRTVVDFWQEKESNIIKNPEKLSDFKKQIIGAQIQNIERRGKVIIFTLNNNKTLLAHPKMTGHFLVGRWEHTKKGIRPRHKGAMEDPMNRFIRLIFYFDNEQMLAFSDLRKFGRIELWSSNELHKADMINAIGIDALSSELTPERFEKIIKKAGKKKIKEVLMKQELIAGIGNIYSDEILFEAGVYPLRTAEGLAEYETKAISLAKDKILQKAVQLKGTSVFDYRTTDGTKGDFQQEAKVYGREGKQCSACGAKIRREKIGSRSTHYCPSCQG